MTETSTQEVVAAIETLEQRWIEVYLARDTVGFEALMTEDFIYTSVRGVFDRASYVNNLASGEIEMRAFENQGLEVRVHGDAAISTGTAALQASFQGQDISGPERFTRVWVREPAGWRAAALHASAASAD